MASLLRFPTRLFAESPEPPARTSPSAEEAAMTRPRRGLRLVPAGGYADERREAAFDISAAILSVVAQIDGEIARQVGRERGGRMPAPVA